jgi:hypothetical protein
MAGGGVRAAEHGSVREAGDDANRDMAPGRAAREKAWRWAMAAITLLATDQAG